MNLLFKDWLDYKSQIDEIRKKMIGVEDKMSAHYKEQLAEKEEGAVSITDDGYKLKITKRWNRTVDQKGAEQIGGLGLANKYSWSKTEYNKLSDAQKFIVDAVVTAKPGKSTFSIEEAENEDN